MTPEDEKAMRSTAMLHIFEARNYVLEATGQLNDASKLLESITYKLEVPIILGGMIGRLNEVLRILEKDQTR